MKNKLTRLALLTLITICSTWINLSAQPDGPVGCSYCGKVRKKNPPALQEDLKAGVEYTFQPYITTPKFKRKFRVVIAKKVGERLVPVVCERIKAGECYQIPYGKAKTDHTVYVTFKFRNWTQIFWSAVDDINRPNNYVLCNGKIVKSTKALLKLINPAIIRKAINSSGGGGTTSTTIDEK